MLNRHEIEEREFFPEPLPRTCPRHPWVVTGNEFADGLCGECEFQMEREAAEEGSGTEDVATELLAADGRGEAWQDYLSDMEDGA